MFGSLGKAGFKDCVHDLCFEAKSPCRVKAISHCSEQLPCKVLACQSSSIIGKILPLTGS